MCTLSQLESNAKNFVIYVTPYILSRPYILSQPYILSRFHIWHDLYTFQSALFGRCFLLLFWIVRMQDLFQTRWKRRKSSGETPKVFQLIMTIFSKKKIGLSRDKHTLQGDFAQNLTGKTPAHKRYFNYAKNVMPNARRVVFRPMRDKTWLLWVCRAAWKLVLSWIESFHCASFIYDISTCHEAHAAQPRRSSRRRQMPASLTQVTRLRTDVSFSVLNGLKKKNNTSNFLLKKASPSIFFLSNPTKNKWPCSLECCPSLKTDFKDLIRTVQSDML